MSAGGWEGAGIIVAVACAIHCTLLSFAAGPLPFIGFQHFSDERSRAVLPNAAGSFRFWM
jgi:hypothetical protein